MSKSVIISFIRNLSPFFYKIPIVGFYNRIIGRRFVFPKIDKGLSKMSVIDKITKIIPNNNEISNISEIEKKQIINSAKKILSGSYNILGSGDFIMNKIDWHSDFKSSFRWKPGKYYKKYIQVQLDNNSDVKIPRELSRFHHLLHVALAYRLTKKNEFADFICNQLIDWIDENPLMYSINWGSAMDVSIRAVNWIWTLSLLTDYDFIENEKKFKRIEISLFQHGWFIYRNLEGSILNYSNNHYLSNLTGLIFLGQLFNSEYEGKKWLDYAIPSFYREVRIQIIPSGMTYERSLHYNRLVLELILWPILSLKFNGNIIPQDIWSRLENMFEFVYYTLRPDGNCPVIGDQDNGRLLPFGTEKLNDFRYLLSIGTLLFNRSDFKYYDDGYNIYCTFLGDKSNPEHYDNINYVKSEIKSKGFPDSGFYTMRHNRNYLIFNGSNRGLYLDGKLSSLHTHSDLFSFDLYIKDKAFIIDPGTYVYTSNRDERNLFRSTSKHNTVVVDNFNQDVLDENNLFQISCKSISSINKWITNNQMDIISAEHNGYMRLNEPVKHTRTIIFNKLLENWFITDELSGSGVHDFQVFFHFNEHINVLIVDKNTIITESEGINIELSFKSNSAFKIVKNSSYISKSYGTKVKSDSIIINSKTSCPFELETNIKIL